SDEHTSELQSLTNDARRLPLAKETIVLIRPVPSRTTSFVSSSSCCPGMERRRNSPRNAPPTMTPHALSDTAKELTGVPLATTAPSTCPVRLRKRTNSRRLDLSALCQKPTYAVQQTAPSI